MFEKEKDILIYIIVIIIANFISTISMINTTMSIVNLIIILPIIIFINAYFFGKNNKRISYIYNFIIGIIFIPVILLVMNSTAWVYLPSYILISFIGNFIGENSSRTKIEK